MIDFVILLIIYSFAVLLALVMVAILHQWVMTCFGYPYDRNNNAELDNDLMHKRRSFGKKVVAVAAQLQAPVIVCLFVLFSVYEIRHERYWYVILFISWLTILAIYFLVVRIKQCRKDRVQ